MIQHAQSADNNRIIIRELYSFSAAPSTTERAASSSLYGAKYRFKKTPYIVEIGDEELWDG
jgi:hypothetical protein